MIGGQRGWRLWLQREDLASGVQPLPVGEGEGAGAPARNGVLVIGHVAAARRTTLPAVADASLAVSTVPPCPLNLAYDIALSTEALSQLPRHMHHRCNCHFQPIPGCRSKTGCTSCCIGVLNIQGGGDRDA